MSGHPAPGLYTGTLSHHRTAGVRHHFSYPLFMAFLDVARIPELMAVSRVTGWNRWNWASFHDADHFGSPAVPLRDRLEADARHHGHALPDGPAYLLTHLRYLGFCFNPVSFVYCYDRGGALRLILAEVSNTFGGSHNYWLPVAADGGGSGRFRAAATKAFYVSPFMADDMRYTFAFTAPAETLSVQMSLFPGAGGATRVFDATLSLAYRPWNAREIRAALVQYPAMTLNVMAAIYWEALKLWWKGLPIVPRPSPDGTRPREPKLDRL